MICKICNEEHPPLGMSSHCKYKHNLTVRQYYDKYLKTDDECKCVICGKPTKFITIVKGYNRFCSKDCQFKYQTTDEYKKKLNQTIQYNKTHRAGKNAKQQKILPLKTIGQGKDSLYVYYYKMYKDRAEQNNLTIYECKIGQTTTDAQGRVLDQFGTAYPEYPIIALVIKCKSGRLMESFIHFVLDNKNRHIKDSPGSEWYLTNPDEVEQIYNNIMNL